MNQCRTSSAVNGSSAPMCWCLNSKQPLTELPNLGVASHLHCTIPLHHINYEAGQESPTKTLHITTIPGKWTDTRYMTHDAVMRYIIKIVILHNNISDTKHNKDK